MKKSTITLLSVIGAIVLVLVIIVGSVIGTYNDFVSDEQEVKNSWSKISVQLQRRADLIPNFINTVKGYTDYEQETLTAVTNARNAFNNAGSVNEQIEASQRLDSAFSVWVNAVTEAYPELKANEQFTALQDELAGTENRIATARNDYNEDATEFNTEIRKFPGNLIAGIFGFQSYELFTHQSGAESVPEISF